MFASIVCVVQDAGEKGDTHQTQMTRSLHARSCDAGTIPSGSSMVPGGPSDMLVAVGYLGKYLIVVPSKFTLLNHRLEACRIFEVSPLSRHRLTHLITHSLTTGLDVVVVTFGQTWGSSKGCSITNSEGRGLSEDTNYNDVITLRIVWKTIEGALTPSFESNTLQAQGEEEETSLGERKERTNGDSAGNSAQRNDLPKESVEAYSDHIKLQRRLSLRRRKTRWDHGKSGGTPRKEDQAYAGSCTCTCPPAQGFGTCFQLSSSSLSSSFELKEGSTLKTQQEKKDVCSSLGLNRRAGASCPPLGVVREVSLTICSFMIIRSMVDFSQLVCVLYFPILFFMLNKTLKSTQKCKQTETPAEAKAVCNSTRLGREHPGWASGGSFECSSLSVCRDPLFSPSHSTPWWEEGEGKEDTPFNIAQCLCEVTSFTDCYFDEAPCEESPFYPIVYL